MKIKLSIKASPAKTAVSVLSALLLVFAVQATATGSWFEKGASFLKSVGGSDTAKELTADEIGAGLKEALKVGSERVVSRVGASDGYNKDPDIHIPLPESYTKAKALLSKVGMEHLFTDLELKMNRAAEAAAPRARQLFIDAITQMTLADVKKIYNGPDDAATQYFKQKMSPGLTKEMTPVVDQTLDQVGAVRSYDAMVAEYKKLPFVPDLKGNLTSHVVQKGMDGIFFYLAKEEAAIRKDPVARTTDLLKKVFGQ